MQKTAALIVDNNAIVRKELEYMLREHCFCDSVLTASTSAEALEMSRFLRPNLIIYDLPMTWSSDGSAISDLRALLPASGIIAISLFEDYRSAALSAGADEFVAKTSPKGALLDAIRRQCPSQASPS